MSNSSPNNNDLPDHLPLPASPLSSLNEDNKFPPMKQITSATTKLNTTHLIIIQTSRIFASATRKAKRAYLNSGDWRKKKEEGRKKEVQSGNNGIEDMAKEAIIVSCVDEIPYEFQDSLKNYSYLTLSPNLMDRGRLDSLQVVIKTKLISSKLETILQNLSSLAVLIPNLSKSFKSIFENQNLARRHLRKLYKTIHEYLSQIDWSEMFKEYGKEAIMAISTVSLDYFISPYVVLPLRFINYIFQRWIQRQNNRVDG